MTNWIRSLVQAGAAAAVGFALLAVSGCSEPAKKAAPTPDKNKAGDHADHDHGDKDHKHADGEKHADEEASGDKPDAGASEPGAKEKSPIDPAGEGDNVQTGEPPEIDLPNE